MDILPKEALLEIAILLPLQELYSVNKTLNNT